MSLLNDMLRDLVKQQQPASQAKTFEQVARREAVSVDDGGVSRFVKICLVFIVVFTLVLLVKNSIKHQFYSSNENLAPAKPIEAKQKNKLEIKAAPAEKLKESLRLEPQVAKINSPLADESIQQKIELLLLHAKLAVSQDKLTSPIEDNAFADYQRVLEIDANNLEAKQGIEFIASRYLARAQEQLKLGNTQQAQAYFQRAEFVAPDYFQGAMETAAGSSVETNLAHSELKSESKNADVAAALESKSSANQQPENNIAENKTLESKTITTVEKVEAQQLEPQHLKVMPTAKWQDEDSARLARDLVNRHQVAEAKALLEKSLAANFNSPRSIGLLHELYLQESNFVAADDLTRRADFLAEDQRNLMRAQSLLVQTKETEAIQLLEQHLAAAEKNEVYRALLASLYHKTAQYQSSVTQYQRMINQFGDKPAYWLGLALGYDGLVQPKNAEQCYQHLKKFTQLQPQVIAYIDKRLAALRVN